MRFSQVPYSTGSSVTELKVLVSGPFRTSMAELLPRFEQSSGVRVVPAYGAATVLEARIRQGEAADVAFILTDQIADMAKQGLVAPDSVRDVARVGFGMAVRPGTPRPDVSTVEAFKRTLLAAERVAFSDPSLGGFGRYLMELFETLGIAAEMKPKVVLGAQGRSLHQVADGSANIGFAPMPEIFETSAVAFVGPLPPAISRSNSFSAGVIATSAHPEAALAFIAFATSAEAGAVMRSNGLEPC